MTDGDGDPPVEVEVTNNQAANRYEAHIDGALVGLTTYRVRDNVVVFIHAEVYPRWEGHGVGSALARAALDDVVARGLLIGPRCPFIVSYIQNHPAYLAHVDPADRLRLEATPTDSEGS